MFCLMWALRVQFAIESSIAAMTDPPARGHGFVALLTAARRGSGSFNARIERGTAQAKGLIGGRNGYGLAYYSMQHNARSRIAPDLLVRKKGTREKRKRGMGVSVPSRQTLTIGKEAMKKLRHFCVDAEVRPNEVVEAMIFREDFEENGENLLILIENNQKNDGEGP
jgi:hypothetical protein